jgi:hypothetical protein
MRWFDNYVSGTLARDLVELADVRRIDDAERLLRLLASQSANLLSYRRVGAGLDMHHETVRAYVALLEQMFLVKRLPAWRPGLGAREASTPKLYVCDKKPAVSSGFPRALCRTRTGDPFLTTEQPNGRHASARGGHACATTA